MATDKMVLPEKPMPVPVQSAEAVRKLPVAIQAVLGLAMFAFGVVVIVSANDWSAGDMRLVLAFFAIGVLYLFNGIVPMLEGFMTMFYRKD